MTKVIFLDSAGSRTEAEVDDESSVMELAVANDVEGVVAECGGNCSCATCHVYVDPGWFGRLPAMDEMEDEMLDGTAAERRPTSRLSCQIAIGDALDGLIVEVPDRQT